MSSSLCSYSVLEREISHAIKKIPHPIRHHGGKPDTGRGSYYGQLRHKPGSHTCCARRPDRIVPAGKSAGIPPGQLNPGQWISSGTQIASPDGKFVLQMQSDGNLVIRAPGNIPIGDTRTTGHDGTIAVMQTDGNFVLRAPGNIPIWASGTDGHPGTVLQVQDDGGVVLYAPGHQVLRVLFPARTPATVPAPATNGASTPGAVTPPTSSPPGNSSASDPSSGSASTPSLGASTGAPTSGTPTSSGGSSGSSVGTRA